MKKQIVFVVAMIVASAHGAILDQTQELSNGGISLSYEDVLAQTFTAGISGQLDYIDLHLDDWSSDPGYPTTISVVNVIDGIPDDTVLGTVNLHIFDHPGWNSINFLSESIFLTADTQYGIVLTNDDTDTSTYPTVDLCIQWSGDPYAGGSLYKLSDTGWQYCYMAGTSPGEADAAFRTYIVPEPATFLLIGLGVVMLRRKRRT